jgi:hypothetical protein
LNTTPDPRSPSAGLCASVPPLPPQTIAGNTTVTGTWSCTPLTLSGSVVYANVTVSATDANSGANVGLGVSTGAIDVKTVCP